MEIRQITEDKDNYLEMLLIADPQENMIRRYLDKSDMFVLEDAGEVLTIGVVEHMKNKRCELKNMVTAQEYRRQGYGTYMVNYLSEYYSVTCDVMYVGTGNNSNTLDFYKQCGFVNSHIVANFFVDHYEKPIYENGIQLTDMIYLKKNLDVVLDVKRVVDMAMHAGRILLKNGGEIFRVEETIKRICGRFHVNHVDIFSMSHGIFVSAENENGEAYTKVNHVPLSSSHLGIVAEVNELSREISAGRVKLEEAEERLEKIQFERTCPKAFFDGYDREPALKNYEGITVQFKMSGMYLTVQPTEEGYKYLVYDQKLHEISGDACGNPEDSIQKAMYASLKNEGLEDVECVKVDDREFRDKVISHSKEVLASGDVRFTSELGRCETALNGMDRAEIEYEVLFHARAVLEEMGLENEVTLIGARVHGSRSRDDLYRADSDLDVVLSYRGNIREDSFFNELNSYGMAIAGIKVDINPILEERITLAEYIKESEAYLDQQEIRKLAVDLDNFSYEYDTYGYKDTVENREEQVEKITEDILNKDTAGLKNWLIEVSEESDIDSDVVTARSLLSRLENAETLSVFTRQPEQEQPEATITFYVAECMEFPVMGEYHENLTLEEALRIYETIPADRMNGIKGVGFELHDGSDYDGPYDLMRLGKVDREGVEMIRHYKESPLVQKAMDDVEKYFAQKQELTKIAEKPVQKENVPQPKSRKESVLQALRERQAKIKEQEQNAAKEKSRTHKKGEVSL